MAVAGDTPKTTWPATTPNRKSILTAHGVACTPVLRGMAGQDTIAAIYLKRLAQTLTTWGNSQDSGGSAPHNPRQGAKHPAPVLRDGVRRELRSARTPPREKHRRKAFPPWPRA
jgi:hypothetical protein